MVDGLTFFVASPTTDIRYAGITVDIDSRSYTRIATGCVLVVAFPEGWRVARLFYETTKVERYMIEDMILDDIENWEGDIFPVLTILTKERMER